MRSAPPAPDPRREPSRGILLLSLAAIVALVAIAFQPAFSAGWVDFDDDHNFLNNHAWRGLDGEHLRWMFTTSHMGHFQPLSWLTLAVDHEFWGLDARGYHRSNVILHAATAIAFLFLARRLLALGCGARATPRSLDLGATFAALFFAVHPLRVESVAWITERRDVLGGFFFVLTVSAWLRYACAVPERRARWYAATLALMTLSLLAKAAAMVLPAVFLVLDVWPLRRGRNGAAKLLREKLPLFALSALAAWRAYRAQGSLPTTLLDADTHTLLERAVQAAYGTAFYAGKTLLPLDLIPLYELPPRDGLLAARYVVPGLFAVAVTVALVLLRRRLPALLAAWLAYAIILSPTSGIAQAGPQLVADRYSYFSCLPFAVLFGAALVLSCARPGRNVWAIGAVIVAGLTLGTRSQTRIWHDTESLWTHLLAIDPDSRNGINGLGSLRLQQYAAATDPALKLSRLREARALFESAWRSTGVVRYQFNYAVTLGEEARLLPAGNEELRRQSWELFDQAMARVRSLGAIETGWRFQYATSLVEQGRLDEALPELEIVVREWPSNPQVYRILSLAHEKAERWSEAAAANAKAIALQPEDPELRLRQAKWLAAAGDRDGAARVCRELIAKRRAAPAVPADDPFVRRAERQLAELERVP